MNKRFYVGLLFLGFTILTCRQNIKFQFEIFANSNNKNTKAESTDKKELNEDLNFYLPSSFSTSQIIKHSYYTLSYNEQAEQADWVAYELKKNYVKQGGFKRPYFIEDPLIVTKSASWKNYKKSGYDKGHLCPAADMEFNKEAFNDTFYTSNISPQNHDFNSGIWNRLEQKIRYWAIKYDGLIVITGGVLKGNLKTIGTEHVAVPKYFYKIVLNRSNGNYKMIAFLIPNEKSSKSIYDYVISVDKIESLTGIDFFPDLDNKIENNLEKNEDFSSWLAKKNFE